MKQRLRAQPLSLGEQIGSSRKPKATTDSGLEGGADLIAATKHARKNDME
jgi:hypothetical protein